MFLFSFFLYFVLRVFVLVFFSPPAPFTRVIFFFFRLHSSVSSVEKAGTFLETEKCSCQFCCFRTNASLKTTTTTTSKPAPFYLLMTWTVVDFNNNLWWLPCLGAIPVIHIPQAWPILYIHEYIDAHSPPRQPHASTMRLHPASISSPQTASSPWLYSLLMGLLQISVKLLEQRESTQSKTPSINSHRSAPKDKNMKKKRNPLHSISIPPEPLVLKHYSLMLQLWWRWRGRALHSTVTCNSLVICQNLHHWHESMFKAYK